MLKKTAAAYDLAQKFLQKGDARNARLAMDIGDRFKKIAVDAGAKEKVCPHCGASLQGGEGQTRHSLPGMQIAGALDGVRTIDSLLKLLNAHGWGVSIVPIEDETTKSASVTVEYFPNYMALFLTHNSADGQVTVTSAKGAEQTKHGESILIWAKSGDTLDVETNEGKFSINVGKVGHAGSELSTIKK
jgi:hypothetical protein